MTKPYLAPIYGVPYLVLLVVCRIGFSSASILKPSYTNGVSFEFFQ